MLVSDCQRALSLEGGTPGEHLVEHHSQRVDVGAGIHRGALRLLGAEIAGGPDHGPGSGEFLGVVPCPDDPEVGHFHRAIPSEQDVPRLDIAMDQPRPVCHGERRRSLGSDLGRSSGEERPVGAQHLAQRAPVHQLHHDEIGGAVFAPVVYGDDVGVAQVGRRLRLAPEAADKGVVGAVLGMENLDGHTSTEKTVARREHVGHSTAGDETFDLVPIGEHL